jgi:acyl-CoA synthetase (AMP-forming)/AMP-acid ligase II
MIELPVYDIIRRSAEQWPEVAAIHDEFGTLTFRELFEGADSLRIELTKSGIKPGMGVGLMAHNGRHFITGLFAIVGCGALAMPMLHQMKKSEIDAMVSESGLHAIVFETRFHIIFNALESVSVNSGAAFNVHFTRSEFQNPFAAHVENPAFMRFTSGTTGKSKGVIISHQSVIERIEGANQALNLGPGDTVIWVLPMAFHFIVSVVLYIKFGATIAVAKDFLAQNIIDITNRYNGTLLYASPMQIRLLANDTGNGQLTGLKRVISTSAGISADICCDFKRRFKISVCQAYGIIEIGLPIINVMKSDEEPESVGYALPGYEVAIFDNQYQILPDGMVGHLGIKGPGMFDAYLKPATMRKDVLVKGYFLTADFAIKSPDGSIRIQGREKSMINISGNKVFPEEVEGVLETIPEVKLAKIYGVPHPLMGQIIEAEILPNEGATIDVEAILTYCRKRLSTYKVPQKLKIVTEMPLTPTGKIIRY